jgi:hypothetical protein
MVLNIAQANITGITASKTARIKNIHPINRGNEPLLTLKIQVMKLIFISLPINTKTKTTSSLPLNVLTSSCRLNGSLWKVMLSKNSQSNL